MPRFVYGFGFYGFYIVLVGELLTVFRGNALELDRLNRGRCRRHSTES